MAPVSIRPMVRRSTMEGSSGGQRRPDCIQIRTRGGWTIPPPARPISFSNIGRKAASAGSSPICTADRAKRKASVDLLVQRIERAPLSTGGRSLEERSTSWLEGSTKPSSKPGAPRMQLLLETMAGRRGERGAASSNYETSSIGSLADRIGFCFDTCHVFAVGYDIRGFDGFARAMGNSTRCLNDSVGDQARQDGPTSRRKSQCDLFRRDLDSGRWEGACHRLRLVRLRCASPR